MPFTLSHPAFAVPIRRLLPGKLALPGVVLGSMSPDLEYFVRMEAGGTIGHELSGFVSIGLPLCFALCCAYLFIIRPALSGFVPNLGGLRDYVHDRTHLRSSITLIDWLLFIWAAIAGFGTHLFMDAWTHSSGLFVRHIETLSQPMLGSYVFHWLQYLTSIIGAGIIGAWIVLDFLRWRRNNRREVRNGERRDQAIDYAFFARWAGAGIVGLLVLLVKLGSMELAVQLTLWTVAPFSAAAVGLYAVSTIMLSIKARRWGSGLSAIVILLAALWALKLGIVSFAAIRLNLSLTPLELWIVTIWVLSALIMIISVQTNRIVKEFVRIGLKSVNNRTLS